MIYAGRRNKLLFCIIALVLVVCSLFTAVQPTIAFASEREVSFEETNVLDDLKSSKDFNILEYPYSVAEDKVKIINYNK